MGIRTLSPPRTFLSRNFPGTFPARTFPLPTLCPGQLSATNQGLFELHVLYSPIHSVVLCMAYILAAVAATYDRVYKILYRRGFTLGQGQLPPAPNLSLAPKCFGYNCSMQYTKGVLWPYSKMRFRPGLRSEPRWGSLRRCPRPSSRMGKGIPPPHTSPHSVLFAPLSLATRCLWGVLPSNIFL